ncbi:MAG: alcohol dehydrogenase catalytic domain-containing protein [Bacteroidales bacterium]|nr:alcohol dehydrogenase catalytic domain-containing protein [Bacteroidales bacterium]
MRKVIMTAPKTIEVQNDAPAPKAEDLKGNEILLNIKRIGICGSEIHSYHGLHPSCIYPVVQGHEYSGIVVAVGPDVKAFKPGDHVTARPQLVCGECNPCKHGRYNICEHLKVQAFHADGAAQDYFVVTEDRTVLLPEEMPLDFGAMIEPTAVGAHATSRAPLAGRNVVVSGAGTIGNLIAQFAQARGAAKVLITDISDLRLAKARECGIKYTLNVSKTPLAEGIKEFFGEEGYQAAFEVAGVESSIQSLMATIEKGGDIVIVAVFAHNPVINMEHLGEHELNLIGTLMYKHEDYLKAVEEVYKGTINLKPLITDRFPLEKFDDAYKFIDAHRETSMKVMIDLDMPV